MRALLARFLMKYLMFYELAADGLSKAQANFPAHQARLVEFHKAGTLLMAGPYGAPPIGAIGIFTSRAAAEAFVAGDPFVINGVVGKYSIHDWSEALAP
ncbi:hypothetical protein HNQ60_005053 [Povalibacter uvarum]|uniref:YCII-related domain-containing protein n=1 Tax=Povalibacter uvarum TaxID=732238 RepID=A0A841HW37_9GAMM|nr:YciI family protein [Povalibacter uvarum]MBB6096162.1 hypothetical protein [Povalibacter uvarum]